VTQSLEAGMNASFSVLATGTPPIFYQWRKNGAPIKDQTNSTLLLTNVHSTDTANYVVVVSNAGGAVTSAVARLIVSFHTAALTVVVDGAGTVKPNLDGRALEIGRTYTLTAKPAAGNIFSNWTGSVTSSAPVLNFVMESNLVLVATFVPSPFPPVKGVYNGLFFDAVAPAHANAGALALTLDDKGRIRGTVRMGARTRRFVGTFSAERIANVVLAATGVDPALSLALQLDTETGVISGDVSNTTFHSTLTAYRNPFSSSANPAPNSGKYNAALPGADDAALAPAGEGFAAIVASTSGRISGKGTLADGAMFKLLSATADNAAVPVYASLYGGRGSLFGWLTISNTGANDVSGTLWWTRPSGVSDRF
jgi:hypothetical protein